MSASEGNAPAAAPPGASRSEAASAMGCLHFVEGDQKAAVRCGPTNVATAASGQAHAPLEPALGQLQAGVAQSRAVRNSRGSGRRSGNDEVGALDGRLRPSHVDARQRDENQHFAHCFENVDGRLPPTGWCPAEPAGLKKSLCSRSLGPASRTPRTTSSGGESPVHASPSGLGQSRAPRRAFCIAHVGNSAEKTTARSPAGTARPGTGSLWPPTQPCDTQRRGSMLVWAAQQHVALHQGAAGKATLLTVQRARDMPARLQP